MERILQPRAEFREILDIGGHFVERPVIDTR
jgi:hypothetical protein